MGIRSVTPKALKNLNFSGYPLTCISISLHLTHSRISTFQDTLSFGYASAYTKSTQKPQLFRMPSRLGMHVATAKPIKNVNFSRNLLTCVYISLHETHSKISNFQDPLSVGYPSAYTKSSQKYQVFTIPFQLGIHMLPPKALKNPNFLRYPHNWVSISLLQKHSKISSLHDTLSVGHPSAYTKSTQES